MTRAPVCGAFNTDPAERSEPAATIGEHEAKLQLVK
jgi:hypothetical protein